MQKGIDSYIKEQFGISEVDIRTYSPLTLAYIGDGIFDLVIRSVVVGKGNTRAGELHKRTSQIVKAHTQAEMIEKLLPMLTEEEAEVYRRGRTALCKCKRTSGYHHGASSRRQTGKSFTGVSKKIVPR